MNEFVARILSRVLCELCCDRLKRVYISIILLLFSLLLCVMPVGVYSVLESK